MSLETKIVAAYVLGFFFLAVPVAFGLTFLVRAFRTKSKKALFIGLFLALLVPVIEAAAFFGGCMWVAYHIRSGRLF